MNSIELALLTAAKANLWMDANLAQRGDDQLRRLARFWNEAENGQRIILAAWHGAIFCGHVTLIWDSQYPPFSQRRIPEIVDLWVAPEYRRQGIGQELIDDIEEIARTHKCVAIGLGVGVEDDFAPARALYTRNDYHADGPEVVSAGASVFMMVKKL